MDNLDLRSFHPLDENTVVSNILLNEAFFMPLKKEGSLLYSYIRAELGDASDSEIKEFQRELLDVQDKIRVRENNKEGIEYEILTPENLFHFVWI